MNEDSHGVIDPVRVGVESAVRLSSLPAFPSPNWCDRAAAGLSNIAGRGEVVVAIATMPGTDASPSIEVVGATDPGLSALVDATGPLGPLGWAAPPRAGKRTFLVSSTPLYAAWSSSNRGKAWKRAGSSDLLVGIEIVPSERRDRVVIVEMGLTQESAGSLTPMARVLESILPVLADRVTRAFNGGEISPASWLTLREQEVLEHLALGRTVRDIADRIGRSPHTVHDHVKSLHKKLNATTRGELVARALGHPRLKSAHRSPTSPVESLTAPRSLVN